jgi:cytochrome c6
MFSTIAPVVAGLSTGNKIGLAAVGAAFLLFAAVSSFVIPRRTPNFPGRHVGWYVVVCVAFFVAMLSAVLIFGREKEEAKASETPTTQSAPPAQKGDPVAGKAVFASAGCGSCHTLKAAASTGAVGPNLDQLKPPLNAIVNQVIHGGGPMPAFKGQLSDKQIQDVAAFVFTSTH